VTAIGTIIEGKYEILREIGRGGMSVVYLAMDTRLNKQWAVKEIRKKGSGKNDEIIVNSLLAEANLMKRLDHPALPRIVDIIDNVGTIYIVMDYIEGESLDKVLFEYGVQPEEKVINWAMQIADALSYLHRQKPPIIYRDMKPANVMLKPEGNIKIIDFGIAREYKEQNLADTTVLGTKGYAPPEQYSGQTDPRSDIYALGMTMHHLLTGVDPRRGEAYVPVRQWNPDLSEGIELIIDRCVQPAAENRYQSCAELLYDLENPDLITKGFKKTQKRKLGIFLAAVLTSLLLLAGGLVCRLAGTQIANNNYEALISVNSSVLDEKISSYQQAIEIRENDTRAYMKMIEAYENVEKDDGKGEIRTECVFGKKESDSFLSLYNSQRMDACMKEDPAACAALNFKAGMLYYNHYPTDGTPSFSTRVNKAYIFFKANKDSGVNFADKALSDCFYEICDFHRTFIQSGQSGALIKEATADEYEQLFQRIEVTMDVVQDSDGYNQLALYNSVFVLLHDQKEHMAKLGVGMERVTGLFNQVTDRALELRVTKEQSVELQKEIAENKDAYLTAILRAYGKGGRS